MVGKSRRLKRLFRGKDRRCLLVPLDHGPWLGPVEGIVRPRSVVEKLQAGGANALLVSPGFARAVEPVLKPSTAVVLRVSLAMGLAPDATQETPVATVDTALRMDADAVAVSIFFGRGGEPATLRYLGELAERCSRYGMPVVAEMMPPQEDAYDGQAVAHAARIGFELGADIIKTNYCGDVEAFRRVVAASPVPILTAGGPMRGSGDESTLQLVREVIAAGAAGVAMGRRVWQSDDPEHLVRKIHSILFPDETKP
jgi:fructose-bisphosphate aldolase/2-amino-3,7-dideoxy-D-threo-hept-6-ulosonate synthase